MKFNHLLIILALLASCADSQTKQGEATVKEYFATVVAGTRKYEALNTVLIPPPSHATASEGEKWYMHRYVLTDTAGKAVVRQDTVLVQPNGRVQFW